MGQVAQVVLALLDGVSHIWDWTRVYEGPPRRTYTVKFGSRTVVVDDKTAAAIHRDWVMLGGDMRKAMDTAGRSAIGQG